jgi:hypothetical protein
MTIILHVLLNIYNCISLITRWYHLLTVAGFGLMIYLAVLFLFKEFTKNDLEFYLDTLNVKKMIDYIKDELKNH